MNQFDLLENSDLRLENKVHSGYRLYKLEVYNWGTFNKNVWTFKPEGETALLTGDVGSGKSTLVDALTTLFVPSKKIQYNKAADASAKERTLASYVLGYYGQKRSYEGKGKPEALRNDNNYSVLIATFKDEFLSCIISIAQFFWFKEQQDIPSRFYIVSDDELFVKRDFSRFNGDIKKLKANLKEHGVSIFDDFNHYSESFRQKLGNLKEQAVDLFQQTISMKKVEELTEFVRSNMLEKSNTEERIQKLLIHYNNLNTAYEAIIRTRNQLLLLTPIYNDGTKFVLAKDKLLQIENSQKTLETWFAHKKESLYEENISENKNQQLLISQQLNIEKNKLDVINSNIEKIKIEIWENGGAALDRLKSDLQQNEKELSHREKSVNRYKEQATKVDFIIPNSIEEFQCNFNKIPLELEQILNKRENVQDDLSTAVAEVKKINDRIKETEDEIASLNLRTSNIRSELILLREKLCEELNIPKEEMPFIGELLEVKESELAWEGAIERLLHSFALSMLVSEEHSQNVAGWLDNRNLGLKIVYFTVNLSKKYNHYQQVNPLSVFEKLNIKADSPYRFWLSNQVNSRFDYVCCDNLNVFERTEKAITKAGQIKSKQRHEKDDRTNINDRKRYALGFSNQRKIEAYLDELKALNEEKSFYKDEKDESTKIMNTLQEKISALNVLMDIDNFILIDTKSINDEIFECKRQIFNIENSSNILNDLNKQLNEYNGRQSQQSESVNEIGYQQRTLSEALNALLESQLENKTILESEDVVLAVSTYPFLDENKSLALGDVLFALKNVTSLENRYNKFLADKLRAHQREVDGYQEKIVEGMIKFRLEYSNMVNELDNTIHSLGEYSRLFERLKADDLPKYQDKFKSMLRKNTIHEITTFQANLDIAYKSIKRRISEINDSLYNIDYNPGRFIKIEFDDSTDAEIKGFRSQLRSCTEGLAAGFNDEDVIENSFYRIKEIISRFKGRAGEVDIDAKWTKKVTDVRNWLVFSASERVRKSGEEHEHYTDSGGKSGGQKEKLAYTILAASLVYNYGINQEFYDKSSFRFVVIDEAFLKSSDDSARYGLKLFEKLKFQLLVVTPLLKIPTIEPFISHVGFVSHDDMIHESLLANITIDEFKKKRSEWEENQRE